MKKQTLCILLLLISSLGLTQEVNFLFNLTPTTNNNDGAIEARISGVSEGTEVICTKIGEGEMPIHEMHFDFETEEYVVMVIDLNEGDYLFRVDYEGQSYEKDVHLAVSTQTNPLTISFTTQNQQGSNLGQITAVITTGSIEPNEVHCHNENNESMAFSSSVYNATNHTLTVVVTNLPAGEYTFQVDDGTFYLEQSTTVLYQVVSLSAEFNVKHVTNSADAEITALISGGTANSVVTLNKHGDPTAISFTTSFDAGTYKKTIIASGLNEGVYELHASENGFDVYSYVWVGKYGATTTLSVQPDANYGIDAMLSRWNNRPGHNNINTNYSSHPMAVAASNNSGYDWFNRSVIKFQYNGLEKSELTEAKLNLSGYYFRNQGIGGGYANEVYVRRVENGYNWDENTVTWNTQPLATSNDQGIISQYGGNTSGSVQYSKEVTITNLVKEQLKTSVENNGFLMGLMTDNKYRTQNFYSSDHTEILKRPKLTLTFQLPEQKPFVMLKKKLDGGFVTLDSDRKLRFIYREEYNDQDEKLSYKVYNDRHELVMSDVLNTTLPLSKRLDVTDVKYGQNRIALNIDCCLSCGKYFTLEVTNEKNEKWYLRFKTDSNDGSNGGAVTSYPMGHPCSNIGM